MRFLYYDKIDNIEKGKSIVGAKTFTLSEEFFRKHFKKQALVRPMIVGDKAVPTPLPASQDNARTRLLALVLLLLCAAAVYGIVSLGDGALPTASYD